jgi:hypothetical protein
MDPPARHARNQGLCFNGTMGAQQSVHTSSAANSVPRQSCLECRSRQMCMRLLRKYKVLRVNIQMDCAREMTDDMSEMTERLTTLTHDWSYIASWPRAFGCLTEKSSTESGTSTEKRRTTEGMPQSSSSNRREGPTTVSNS